MNFPEFDAALQTLIRNTVEDCGGDPADDAVEACATDIERLAFDNVSAIQSAVWSGHEPHEEAP